MSKHDDDAVPAILNRNAGGGPSSWSKTSKKTAKKRDADDFVADVKSRKTKAEPKAQTHAPEAAKAVAAQKAKAAAKPERARNMGIGAFASALILGGASNQDAFDKTMKQFPDCHTNMNCMAWYRMNEKRKIDKKLKAGQKLTADEKALIEGTQFAVKPKKVAVKTKRPSKSAGAEARS